MNSEDVTVKCPACVVHESVNYKNQKKVNDLKALCGHIRATLSEAIYWQVPIDPVRLGNFLEKRLTEIGE